MYSIPLRYRGLKLINIVVLIIHGGILRYERYNEAKRYPFSFHTAFTLPSSKGLIMVPRLRNAGYGGPSLRPPQGPGVRRPKIVTYHSRKGCDWSHRHKE